MPTLFLADVLTNFSGRWEAMGEVLNDVANPNARIFYTDGGSEWIKDNYGAARAEGVTFRAVSTTDFGGNVHDFVVVWSQLFDAGLGRAFSLLDTDDDDYYYYYYYYYYYEQQAASGIGEGEVLDDPPDDSGLSFGVSLRFE